MKNLKEVVDWRMCIGCGACAYICPEQKIELWNYRAEGIRPVVATDSCSGCRVCLDVCPAVATDFSPLGSHDKFKAGDPGLLDRAFVEDWGTVLEVWEGCACDDVIRYQGSSGGVLTALSVYCIEQGGMEGVLHIGAQPDAPYLNETRFSKTREELLAAAGSRYSPASVCDSLGRVESASAPCVVIGKPGEIAGLRNAERLKPALREKVGVTLSFFCAESPSTEGTLALLREMNHDPESLESLRYRGHGWPGHFAPVRKGAKKPMQKMTYSESWRFLQSFRPWSVHLWPDGTGECADVSCGDPWYENPDGNNPGFSLIAVRTERGRALVRAAMEAGYLKLTPADAWKLVKSQQYLAEKKASIWGRRAALRLFGCPVTKFTGASLFACWLRLPLAEKAKSFFGTIKRILARKLYRTLRLDPADRISPRSARQSTVEPIRSCSCEGTAGEAPRPTRSNHKS